MGKNSTETVETGDSTLEQKNRDRIALVISILFVLAIGFLGYKFLNNSPNVKTAIYNVQQETKENTENNVEDNIMASNTTRSETEADNANNDVVTNPTTPQVAGTSDEAIVPMWEPNDYSSGDIKAGDSYTVAEGDTLWEIAEAAYGNGADWVRILEANSGDIGFLANGQQSLIVPGQTLVIPVIN